MLYQRFRQGNVLISHKSYSKYHNESIHKSARDLLHNDEENSSVLHWLLTSAHSEVSLSGGAPSDQKSVSLAHRVEAQLSQVIVQPHLRPF